MLNTSTTNNTTTQNTTTQNTTTQSSGNSGVDFFSTVHEEPQLPTVHEQQKSPTSIPLEKPSHAAKPKRHWKDSDPGQAPNIDSHSETESIWQQIKKVMATYVVFRPYGQSLLTARAKTFLMWMFILTVTTAFIESFTWYQLIVNDPDYIKKAGDVSNPHSVWVLVPWVLTMGVFMTAWMVDASIVLLDLYGLKAWQTEQMKKNNERLKVILNWWKDGWGTRLAVLLRFFIFLFSVVAALLGSVLNKEREDVTKKATVGAYQSIEQQIINKKENNPKIAALEEKIESRKDDLIAEIEGRSRSGKFGDGPSAAEKRRQIIELKEELKKEKDAFESIQTKFKDIQNNNAKLKDADIDSLAKYGIEINNPGSSRNLMGIVIDRLFYSNSDPKTNKSNESTNQNPSKTFKINWPEIFSLLFSFHGAILLPFLGIMITKLFQPPSVAQYLSEELQTGYSQVGRIDQERLPDDIPISYTLGAAKNMHPTEFSNFWMPFINSVRVLYNKNNAADAIPQIIANINKQATKEEYWQKKLELEKIDIEIKDVISLIETIDLEIINFKNNIKIYKERPSKDGKDAGGQVENIETNKNLIKECRKNKYILEQKLADYKITREELASWIALSDVSVTASEIRNMLTKIYDHMTGGQSNYINQQIIVSASEANNKKNNLLEKKTHLELNKNDLQQELKNLKELKNNKQNEINKRENERHLLRRNAKDTDNVDNQIDNLLMEKNDIDIKIKKTEDELSAIKYSEDKLNQEMSGIEKELGIIDAMKQERGIEKLSVLSNSISNQNNENQQGGINKNSVEESIAKNELSDIKSAMKKDPDAKFDHRQKLIAWRKKFHSNRDQLMSEYNEVNEILRNQ